MKNRLSHYLNKVANGETVWVTNRNEIVAEIRRPGPRYDNPLSRLEAYIQQQEKRGTVQRATREKSRIMEDLTTIQNEEDEPGIDWKKLYDITRSDR